jgi:uncharacterized protein (TIGR03437 family)
MRKPILTSLIGVFTFVSLLWANRDGTQPRKTGGPFPSESVCSECHSHPQFVGPNRDTSGSIDFSVQNYRPGETQRITVTVSHPTQLRWGFQLTARPANNLTQQAGAFRSIDGNAQVICDNDTAAPCPASMLQFPTHTLAGTRRGTRNSASFTVEWTAPSSDVGEIVFAAAGNAANGSDTETGDLIYTKQVRVSVAAATPSFTSVSSASFAPNTALAAEVIAAGFGSGLARETAIATAVPLPTELQGTKVEVTDSRNVTRAAPLFFVSASQINYLIPAGTALGAATVKVTSGAGGTITGTLQIERVAPALYTANAQGNGVAAALFLRVAGDGTRTQALIFDPNTRASVPIDLGAASDQVFLLMFGTGVRGAPAGSVSAALAGQSIPVVGAAPQGEFVGLDQVNLGPIPRALAGRGEVDLVLTVDSKPANTVKVNIR